jgi:formylmethanofuran dehydrogenase subunit E
MESLDAFLVKLGYEANKKQLVAFRDTGKMAVFRYCRKKGKYLVTATVTDVTAVRQKEEEERARISWIKKAEAIVIKHDASVFMSNIDFKDVERLQKLNALVRSRNERIKKIESAIERERA